MVTRMANSFGLVIPKGVSCSSDSPLVSSSTTAACGCKHSRSQSNLPTRAQSCHEEKQTKVNMHENIKYLNDATVTGVMKTINKIKFTKEKHFSGRSLSYSKLDLSKGV